MHDKVLRPAGQTRSLTHLAVVDGFEANPDGVRGLRIGIDASIWFYHATYGREGENPELRTLFFRCTRLMSTPFLPLFVFDGPKRPEFKRGKRVSGKNHWMVQGMQEIINAFGFEWIMVNIPLIMYEDISLRQLGLGSGRGRSRTGISQPYRGHRRCFI